MNCKDAEPLVHAYIDEELDAANALLVEQHLNTCAQCRRDHDEYRKLRNAIKNHLPRYKVPAELQASILGSLEDQKQASVPVVRQKHRSHLPGGIAFAASILLGIIAVYLVNQHRTESQLIESILSGHVSAINADRLTDINSSQAENLAPWFTSKLDYSPRIYNFDNAGFKLLGGRMDSIQNQRIASITYEHQRHIVNLYTWPSPDVDDAEQEMHVKQGYNLLYWCQNKMNYWIVSDMDAQDMEKLAALVKHKLGPAPGKVQP